MKYFNENQSLDILKDLVAINSVGDNELTVAKYLQDLLAKYDIKSQIKDVHNNRANLIAEIGSGKPVVGITGHMDVVDPGNLADWNSDPFTLTEKSGTLYGRGVCDMKSGLAAAVIAMIELHKQGLPKTGTIRLLATMSEEIGEEGSRYLLEDGNMKDVDALIVGEPTGYNMSFDEKGSMDIKVTSQGKTSHSSMPQFGYNAIDALMNFLTEANSTFRKETNNHNTMGPLVFDTTTIKGGTQVNSIPNLAQADINVRTIPEFNNQQVIDMLDKLVDKYNQQGAHIALDVYMNEKPISMKKDNLLVPLTIEAMKKYTNGAVTYLNDTSVDVNNLLKKYNNGDIFVFANPGITDASNLVQNKPADFPFIVAGPGNLTSHKVNEELDKQMYFNFIDLYENLTINCLDKLTVKVQSL